MHPEPLIVRGLTVQRAGAIVLEGVDAVVRPGQILAVTGGNGTGKSTLLKAISGLLPYRGEIWLGTDDLRPLGPDQIARLGIGHLSQDRRVFPNLTVAENLQITEPSGDREYVDTIDPLVTFPELRAMLRRRAGDLSGGQQQMLNVARVLRRRPRFLLADEPSSGLSGAILERLRDILQTLAANHVGIVLVEHREGLLAIGDSFLHLRAGHVSSLGTGRHGTSSVGEGNA